MKMSRKKELLHHGLVTEEFNVVFTGSDYFTFFHTPCKDETEGSGGHCDVPAVLIDNTGRVIFNLKCKNCGKVDALKMHPRMWEQPPDPKILERFHLSPGLKKRVGKHDWDDV